LITLKNFFVRPIIMGRSVHMNEGVVFIAIIIATILEGILGALLIVPVLASLVVIAGYIQRKILGLPAFEDDGSTQFVTPPEKLKPRHRDTNKLKHDYRADDESDSFVPQPASASKATTNSKTNPVRKKTEK